MEDDKHDKDRRGIQSIEVGGQLLLALAHQGRAMALKDLARAAGMAPAKAHPYLVSFGKLGLIEQDRLSGHYGLGPLALQLGLISLQQADPVRVATPLIADLAQQIGHSVAIAVWGTRGPTVVRLEESPTPVHVNMRHGTVVSVTDTASGRLFAAYLPTDKVRAVLDEERRREAWERERAGAVAPVASALPTWEAFAPQLDEVRAHRMSRSEGAVIEGISAMSAPVFDHTGAMVLAVTAIGPSGTFDTRWEGPIAQALRQCAGAIGRRLGGSA
ncbi:IclR family transcriptional regulator [Caldimonas brevitalea]|uniref:IclR family transcriptional regulator n=1 Tax=Caldimonas brevitalea TaxID=413882 RepID=A0A0G3BEE7_9BURK|nr:IclR family transcriptional regulator [Caldimonas brevitalea]AKJ27697.1 IclR family transcriptional regulator [Caldimonas brevitalea]